MNAHLLPRLDRRQAIKWMIAASAGAALARGAAGASAAKGYGRDAVLNKTYAPGDFWPLTFTAHQRRTAAALCAVIIPAEGDVPSAADLKVHDFIDEWISAPYPDQQEARQPILDGLAWLDAEGRRRFGRDFVSLDADQSAAICRDICHAPDAMPEFAAAAAFFALFRDLTAGGFYSTPAGMKDIGYVGNMPLIEFKGPPPEVLKHLGLA